MSGSIGAPLEEPLAFSAAWEFVLSPNADDVRDECDEVGGRVDDVADAFANFPEEGDRKDSRRRTTS